MSQKRDEIYKKLIAPFPDKAYSADISRSEKVLTSLKAHYVVERLNEVFGLGMWKLTGDWKDVDDGILFIGELSASYEDGDKLVTLTTGPVPGFGGVDHATSGDAYKSARTDCLSKSASLLGVGNEMYKGNVEPRLSDAQKQLLEERGQAQEEEPKEETQEEKAPAKEEKPKKRGFQKLSKKKEESEETKEASSEEKPQLRPARSFYRGSKLKPNRENEEHGTSESTDNATE
jgi:hypothetical protein